MPPASRGLQPALRRCSPFRPVRQYRTQSCLRSAYRPPGRRTASTTQPPENAVWSRIQRLGGQSQALLTKLRASRIWEPLRTIQRQLMRIPAPYRRFIGNVLKFLPIVSVVIIHFPYQIMHTNGSSMSPFLNPNNAPHLPENKDKLLVRKLSTITPTGLWRPTSGPDSVLKRGEIVIFVTPHDPTKVAVKRVVGLPGDKITPLTGFDGPEQVVVRYNHIWVEGDVDDREKSRDSNWYGQISQNLVIGKVMAVLEPWYAPQWLKIEEHNYPAKRKGRVVVEAVYEEAIDLRQREVRAGWKDERVQSLLRQITESRGQVINEILSKKSARAMAVDHYRRALAETMRDDPQTRPVASAVVEKLASIFTEAGFDIVQDEHRHMDLQPNETALQKMARRRRAQPIEEMEPEEALKMQKQAYDVGFAKAEQELAEYDQWSWFSHYRPKSVMAGHLERKKKDWEKEYNKMQQSIEAEKERERLERGHYGATAAAAAASTPN